MRRHSHISVEAYDPKHFEPGSYRRHDADTSGRPTIDDLSSLRVGGRILVMADTFDAATRSWIMSRVSSTNTAPEVAVRRALHRAGYRFRLHRMDLPGTPDIVLPRFRVAVFVHGCFWHGHSCPRFRWPRSNIDYWKRKIERNIERDKRVQEQLRNLGWTPQVIWTCSLIEGLNELLLLLASRRCCFNSIESYR